MRVNIQCPASYAIAYCHLESGETLRAESGSMACMSSGLHVRAGTGPGGVAKGILRKTLGGESFFMTTFTAQVHHAWVGLTPKYPGDIATVEITPDRGLMAETGSMLALSGGLDLDVRFAGMAKFALREGAVMNRIRGEGTALLCTYGGIQRFDLAAGESMVIDTGHLVAMSEGMPMRTGPLHGVVTAAMSGEGLVAEIEGPGLVLVQTRAEQQLRSWLLPHRAQNRG